MHICTNCGAEINKTSPKCSYCGMYTAEGVEKQHRDKIKKLEKEKNEIRKLPDIIPKKASRYLVIICALVIAFTLVILLIYHIENKISHNLSVNNEQKNIEVMEELLLNEDYKGFYDFYENVGYSYVVYDKYEEISKVYYLYRRMQWCFDSIKEYGGIISKEYTVEHIVDAMKYLRDMCNEADEMANNNERFSNVEHLENIKNIGINEFKDFMLTSDEIVEQIISASPDDENPDIYTEISLQLYENLESTDFGREN